MNVDLLALTPVERMLDGAVYVKRDDLFQVAGVRGGKVRTCWALAQGAKKGLVTAGSRYSPQINIVAHIARHLGIACEVHTTLGALSPEVLDAINAGAHVNQHAAGYNSVLISRAKKMAHDYGFTYIPFGMECEEAVAQTRRQVANVPEDARRIVVPVGSGMSLAGILWGLLDQQIAIPVLGVQVGADPTKRLDRFAPPMWRMMDVSIISSGTPYHKAASVPSPWSHDILAQMRFDPYYEAKCIPFLRTGDLFWMVGVRKTA